MIADSLAERIALVRSRIDAAAQRSGRAPQAVRLIGVTKTHPVETLAAALAAGLYDLGENRVQEAEAKIAALAGSQATWHLIGHLQSNKARRAAYLFDWIHSVDSTRLAQALSQAALERKHPLRILLQVNVSGEASKEGFALQHWQRETDRLEQFSHAVEQILALPGLQCCGLMTIAPWGTEPEQARPWFESTRVLRDWLARNHPHSSWAELSMGMSDDYVVAIEEGATMVRVGRALFGARV